VYFDTELLGGRLDALPRRIAFGIGHTVNLIEARNGIADMARVLEWLLALSGKRKFPGVETIALFRSQFGHGNVQFASDSVLTPSYSVGLTAALCCTSVKEEIRNDENDGRNAKNPAQEILAHDDLRLRIRLEQI
jgi:hypothetical protein